MKKKEIIAQLNSENLVLRTQLNSALAQLKNRDAVASPTADAPKERKPYKIDSKDFGALVQWQVRENSQVAAFILNNTVLRAKGSELTPYLGPVKLHLIPWSGGECPVDPDQIVAVMTERVGVKVDEAKNIQWSSGFNPITGYRPLDFIDMGAAQ